jgi:hypothetical protein
MGISGTDPLEVAIPYIGGTYGSGEKKSGKIPRKFH